MIYVLVENIGVESSAREAQTPNVLAKSMASPQFFETLFISTYEHTCNQKKIYNISKDAPLVRWFGGGAPGHQQRPPLHYRI